MVSKCQTNLGSRGYLIPPFLNLIWESQSKYLWEEKNIRPAVPAWRPLRFFYFCLRTLAFKCVFCESSNGPLIHQEWSPWTMQKTQWWRNTLHCTWHGIAFTQHKTYEAPCAADSRSGPWPLSAGKGYHQGLFTESASISLWKSFTCLWNEDHQQESRGTKCTCKNKTYICVFFLSQYCSWQLWISWMM